MGRPNYVNLNRLEDVRRFMSRLINQRNNNLIASAKYRDLFYGLKGLREVLEGIFLQSEIMERLARLEGNTYIPPTLPSINGGDGEDTDLDEHEGGAEGGEQWV